MAFARLRVPRTRPALLALGALLALTSSYIPASRAEGTWSRLATTTGVHSHSTVFDAVHQRLIVFGGSRLGTNSNDVLVLPLTGVPAWERLDPPFARPTPRSEQAVIYDPVRNRLIVHGGNSSGGVLADTWELSLNGTPVWTQLVPSGTAPVARYGHRAIYDPVRDRMLIFGGHTGSSRLADVWSLSLSGAPAWTSITPTGTPPRVRWGHSAVYDPLGDRMLVFGGVDLTTPLADTWALTLSGTPAWSNLAPEGTPPGPRWTHGAAWDEMRGRMLVFGGYNGGNLGDVWELTLGGTPTWAPLAAGGTAPAARFGMGWIHDPVRDRMVLCGGGTAQGDADDVWELSLAGTPQWELEIGPPTPVPWRIDHGMALDPVGQRMILIGGIISFEQIDVYALSLTGTRRWSAITPLGTPPAGRHRHTTTYDPARHRIVVIGGLTEAGQSPSDTEVWALDLNGAPTWTRLTPTGTPPAGLTDHTAVLDPVRDRVIVFGGDTYTEALTNRAWSLSLAGDGAWSELSPSGVPPSARTSHTAIYDAVRDRMVVYGGHTTIGTALFDVWSLSLGGAPVWAQLQAGPSRSAHTAVYDQVGDRMIVFGGMDASHNLRGETWSFPLASTGWVLLQNAAPLPPGRTGHAAIWYPNQSQMIVFGGGPDPYRQDEVWILNLTPVIVSAPPATASSGVELSAAFPDPARGDVTIGFSLPASAPATLRILDVSGRLVRVLVDGPQPAGPQRLRWDRRSTSGELARPGVYFYELLTGSWRSARRLVVLD